MKRSSILLLLAVSLFSCGKLLGGTRPNLVWILADDLGLGELGSYGQKQIWTPQLDRMASEGMRFTQFYAGATVCAPSRSVLMTGQHHGRTTVRGNAGPGKAAAQALREGDITVAGLLQKAGYHTVLCGKWGLGDDGDAARGLPRRQGFSEFFGFLNQTHAHNHYPDFLWRNEERVSLPNRIQPVGSTGAGYGVERKVYADDRIAEEAIRALSAAPDKPLFLYWSLVVPHANNEKRQALGDGSEVPDEGSYAGRGWPAPDRGHAAMVTWMDTLVGRFLEALRKSGRAENTLVIFTSDNGPHRETGHDPARFAPSGPFRGEKRSLTEGGIRVPMIAWWPGKVPAGAVNGQVAYAGDWMATACALAGVEVPGGRDSVSFAPALRGEPMPSRDYLYWEFHEGGFRQAVLADGRWKGIRRAGQPIVLHDLRDDPGESADVAAAHPEEVRRIREYLRTARTESADWPAPAAVFHARPSSWEGYERHDFTVGGRQAWLVRPKESATGQPWIWRTEFFGHEPQADLALLAKGYHVAYVDVQNLYGAPRAMEAMQAFHRVVTEEYGLSPRPVLEGFSRGGLFALNWAILHPELTSCLYLDAPVCDMRSWPAGWGKGKGSSGDWERCRKEYGLADDAAARAFQGNPVDQAAALARARIPVLAVCGDADDVVPLDENAGLLRDRCAAAGWEIALLVKPGVGHHPHSLRDPGPIVEFVVKHTKP
jgi:arylsulfatase A-like enzyme